MEWLQINECQNRIKHRCKYLMFRSVFFKSCWNLKSGWCRFKLVIAQSNTCCEFRLTCFLMGRPPFCEAGPKTRPNSQVENGTLFSTAALNLLSHFAYSIVPPTPPPTVNTLAATTLAAPLWWKKQKDMNVTCGDTVLPNIGILILHIMHIIKREKRYQD